MFTYTSTYGWVFRKKKCEFWLNLFDTNSFIIKKRIMNQNSAKM